jgi:hypothetical protein
MKTALEFVKETWDYKNSTNKDSVFYNIPPVKMVRLMEAYGSDLQKELEVTERLLEERQKVLDAIPECESHGSCIPNALEWIEKMKSTNKPINDMLNDDGVQDAIKEIMDGHDKRVPLSKVLKNDLGFHMLHLPLLDNSKESKVELKKFCILEASKLKTIQQGDLRTKDVVTLAKEIENYISGVDEQVLTENPVESEKKGFKPSKTKGAALDEKFNELKQTLKLHYDIGESVPDSVIDFMMASMASVLKQK